MPTPYTKEQIAQANRVSLIDYAAMHGYPLEKGDTKSLHVKHSGGLYLFKDSNQFYHHTTEKTGGPIDFIIQFEGKDFLQAVEHLINERPNIGEYIRYMYNKIVQPVNNENERLVKKWKQKSTTKNSKRTRLEWQSAMA